MQQRYSLGAIILHWLIAAALAFQLAVGFGLDDLGARGFALYQLHKSVGIAILLLTLLRLGWRFLAPRPQPLERGWQGALAGAVHLGLYAFMLGAPLSGWLMVSTDKVRVPTLLFGALPWPHIPVPARLNPLFDSAHAALGWIGLALFVLHVAGAMRHQWLIRDRVMLRVSPGRTALPVLLLALMLPLAWGLGAVALHRAAASPSTTELVPDISTPRTQATATAAKPQPEARTDTSTASPPVWTIHPGGTLAFSASNAGTSISGRFARWRGEIAFDPDRPERAEIRIVVDLASASVGDAAQDEMLAGSDFFDLPSHPRAIFRATSVRRTGPDHYAATGTLSLKGANRPQALRFLLTGTGLDRHVEGSATISRSAFSIGTGETSGTLGADVTLRFRFDATGKAGAASPPLSPR